jgi:hypothetical protein
VIVGSDLPILGRLINRFVRPVFCPDAQAHAFLTHDVEEVGNFESFLPDLYRKEIALEKSHGSRSRT